MGARWVLLSAILWASLSAHPGGEGRSQFRAATEAVTVDVVVLRQKQTVTGLTAADFSLRDSGVSQSIRLLSVDAMPLDILLLLDVSNSVSGEGIGHLREAALAAASSLRPQDRAAVLTFASLTSRRVDWTRDAAALAAAVASPRPAGFTSLIDATFVALTLQQDPARHCLLAIFTDGVDTASWLTSDQVLETARRSQSIAYVVFNGEGAWIADSSEGAPRLNDLRSRINDEPRLFREAFVAVLASDTGGEVARVSTTSEYRDAFSALLSRFSTRYILSYTPTGASRPGWHPIEVKVKGDGLTVLARRGYSR